MDEYEVIRRYRWGVGSVQRKYVFRNELPLVVFRARFIHSQTFAVVILRSAQYHGFN